MEKRRNEDWKIEERRDGRIGEKKGRKNEELERGRVGGMMN